ncbi:MAG: hypothetical protein GY925_05835 [Actinomycetia bacterium]|nr:hypothetical protein [Actinomycetes bacterium]
MLSFAAPGVWVLALMACSVGSDGFPEVQLQPESTAPGAPTTVAPPPVALDPGEWAIAEEMFESAMSDGIMSVPELRALAVESVECTRRAGFDADLLEWSPRGAEFSIGGGTMAEADVADAVFESCMALYFYPAQSEYSSQG